MNERGRSLSFWFAEGGFLLLLTVILLSGALVGAWRVRETDAFLREELLRTTRVLAETIDIRDVRRLTGSELDLGSPQYESFKNYFRSVLQMYPRSRFLTLVGRRYDGKVFFFVDSEPPGSEDESPPGEVYDAVDPGFLPAFEEGRAVVVGPVVDQWGAWISAWVPLVERGSDRVSAALALDISGEEWQRTLEKAKRLPALTSLFLALLLFAGRWMLQQRTKTGGGAFGRFRYLECLLTLIFGLALTGSVAWMVHERESRSHAQSFSIVAEAHSVKMAGMLYRLRNFVLEGTARFIEALPSLEYESFRRYSQHLSSEPEIDALMWSPRILAEERAEFESTERDEWRRALEIREQNGAGAYVRAEERAEYVPVLFRSPMTGSMFPVGEDLLSHPEVSEALRTAVNTRRPAAAFVRVQYGKEDGSALWVCYPIFRRGFNGALRGVVSALFLPSFMPDEVMGGSGDAGMLSFEALSPEAPPRSLAQWELEGRPEYRFIRPLYAFDGAFAAVLRPGASFLKYHQLRMGLFTSLTGILMTLALVFFVAFTANRRELLEQLVAQRTSELRESESRHRLAGHIYRSLSEGIVVTDPQGYILDGNAALEHLTGYTLDEIRGGRPSMFSAQRKQGEDSLRFWEHLREHGSWQGETWNRRKDGEAYPVWLTVNAVTDENGEVTHYAGVLTHIGDIKSEQQRLSHLAYHDSLTGLPNRLLLADRLEMALLRSRREHSYVAVLFLDLDGFKEINDTYGHETGDVLLVSIARRLDEAVREQDTVARLGGDEFILLFEGLGGVEEPHSLAKRVDALFAEPFVAGGRPFLCSASAGLAVHRPGDGATAQEMLAIADMRMYEAKAQRKTSKALSGSRA